MRTTIIVLALLGALTAGFLGMKWMSDLSALGNMNELQRMAAQSMAAAQGQSLGKMQAASFILIASFFAGLAGAFFALKQQYVRAGGVLLVAGILPVLFQAQAIMFTFLLLLAGGLALLAHSKMKGAQT